MNQQTRVVLEITDQSLHRVLDSLPVGAYLCDANGLIAYFNQQAAKIWGRAPSLHDPADRYCGSLKLYSIDGTPITHDQYWI
uniref:PAS domain-containing protein n=1 Tax=Acinetobacter baumannii TaxID=470 RepID=UPI001158E723